MRFVTKAVQPFPQTSEWLQMKLKVTDNTGTIVNLTNDTFGSMSSLRINAADLISAAIRGIPLQFQVAVKRRHELVLHTAFESRDTTHEILSLTEPAKQFS